MHVSEFCVFRTTIAKVLWHQKRSATFPLKESIPKAHHSFLFLNVSIFSFFFPRPFETLDIDEALEQGEHLSSGTLTPDDTEHEYSSLHFSDSLDPHEEQRSTLPIHQLEDSTTHTIDILGSLCLRPPVESSPSLEDQGIYQGLMMSSEHREIMGVFPDALCMTVNLEQRHAELEGLSVRVLRKTEIVPRTPFDLDTRKKSRERYSGEWGVVSAVIVFRMVLNFLWDGVAYVDWSGRRFIEGYQ